MRIYVAASWRTPRQPEVVNALTDAGHEVYDFRNPPNRSGFHWSDVLPTWSQTKDAVDTHDFLACLKHPIAEAGYLADYTALQWCEACILVAPCGNSAHLELGYCIGAKKPTAILLDTPDMRPDLMYKMADALVTDIPALLTWLKSLPPAVDPRDVTLDTIRDVVTRNAAHPTSGNEHARGYDKAMRDIGAILAKHGAPPGEPVHFPSNTYNPAGNDRFA